MDTFTVYLEGRRGKQTSFTTSAKDKDTAEALTYAQHPRLVVTKIRNEKTSEEWIF